MTHAGDENPAIEPRPFYTHPNKAKPRKRRDC
jgi:hypothetical protein